MANQTISQLPDAGPITGTELVPVVQDGVTAKTTASALAASPVLTQTFLTKNQELTLNNSRYLATTTGLGLADGGPTSTYTISLNGASGSLETAGAGVVVKTGSNTVTSRSMAVSGAGLSVSNADGTGGNPTFALSGIAQAVANLSGTGLMAIVGGTTVAGRQIYGTVNQITVVDGNGAGDPTISISSNPVIPGTGAITLPVGTTAQQPVGAPGQFRFNSDTQTFDGFANGSWSQFSLVGGVTSFSAGSTGLTPSSPTGGPVVLGGIVNVTHGGTGASSLTGYVKGSGTSPLTASATVPTTDLSGTISNGQLANSAVTVNGTTISLGSSGTITATASNALTIGTGLNGTSYNGSTPVTIEIANTGVSAASYGAASKTLTATVNAQGQLTALADTNIAITNTQVSGLGTMSTQNATSVAITGGSINGTTIGASTAAAGTFTSITTTSGTISTTPVNATDIVNKSYVDTLAASGIHFHQPVRVESPINLNATYNNGAAGVGATLTNAGTQAALVIDGVTVNVADRVLVYQQTTQTQNGIYVVSDVGSGSTNWVLTRSSDANTYVINSAAGLSEGSTVFVQEGATGAGETYTCNTNGVITFGTTAITFAQISSAQIYSAGTGLTLSGTQFSITNTGVTAASYGTSSSVPTLAINAQGQVTSASNTAIAINANQITSGTITNSQLQNSSVTVNGSAISLGGSATVTAVNPNALTIGTGLTGSSYDGSAPITIALGTSGVSAATYGSASQVPVFAVDTYGRVTSVTDTPIAISSGAVSGLAASATTDTTNASNITTGTIGSALITGSYTGITGVGTLTAGTWNANTIGVAYGGTGLTATPSNGQLPIGNGTGYSLATLTAGTNVSITNTSGGITISATPAAGGTVTSVDVSGGTTGLTTSGGPVTVSGTITLAGTLNVANGGTGATTLTGYVKGNGTSAFSASTSIPNTDITGLGTMSTQNAGTVAITGGTIEGTSVGATTASTVRGTTITATTQFSGSGAGLTSIPNSATTATNANTASTIVARDGSGNFSAGTITASLSGNASTATTATNQSGGTVSATTGAFSSTITSSFAPAAFNTTTPGLTNYGFVFNGASSADNAQGFTWSWTNGGGAQAGVYVQSSGAYGTRMYLATTDNFSTGAKNALYISESGVVQTLRNYFQANGSIRAPIFYDSDNTSYYLDPTSTTALRTVGDWRADSAAWSGEFAGKMQYHANNWYLQFLTSMVFRNSGGSNIMTCDSSGNVTFSGNVTAYSDARLKENVVTVDSALAKVTALRGVYYNKIGDEKRRVGVIAQEVQEVLPEVVLTVNEKDPSTGEESDMLAVDYGNMVGLLIEAIKELRAEVAALKQGK